MTINSDIEALERELEEKKNELTFEEQLNLRDRILQAKKNSGHTPVHHQISCIGCSG